MEVQEILPQAVEKIREFYNKNPDGIVVIRWATATGKSKLSVLLSEYFPIEIISADSRQLFKEMDIWTDKVSEEIRAKIPHHQINIINPDETYTAGQRKEDTRKIIKQIQSRWHLPIIVGGTGLYIDTLYKNYSLPESAPNRELRNKLMAEEEINPGSLRKKLEAIDPEEAAKHHPNSLIYYQSIRDIWDYWKNKKWVILWTRSRTTNPFDWSPKRKRRNQPKNKCQNKRNVCSMNHQRSERSFG